MKRVLIIAVVLQGLKYAFAGLVFNLPAALYISKCMPDTEVKGVKNKISLKAQLSSYAFGLICMFIPFFIIG